MKQWLKEHKGSVAAVLFGIAVFLVAAAVDLHFNTGKGMTLSEMEELAKQYPPAWAKDVGGHE